MTVKEVAALARRLMNEHGLYDWIFKFDRAKVRAGCCNYSKKTISLSIYYVTKNTDKSEDIHDCLLHELAHALVGPHKGHGPEWKAMCRKIGANPKRCYDSEKIEMPKGRWEANCNSCKKLFYRHRRPYYPHYWCTKCGADKGKLTFKFI